MILLGVNIDHCATLREARYKDSGSHRGGIVEPDPVHFALAAEQAGADQITVHPRGDARHIRRADVVDLKAALQVPLNMEMACNESMTEFALEVRPAVSCLVPENREEVTTEGGLDIIKGEERTRNTVDALLQASIQTSLFIDPEMAQVEMAAKIGSPFIELHTGAFANAWGDRAAEKKEFERILQAAEWAVRLGITVNLGHGINYTNIARLRNVPGVHEMNIGHSIVARSLFTGIPEAVREMKARMNPGR